MRMSYYMPSYSGTIRSVRAGSCVSRADLVKSQAFAAVVHFCGGGILRTQ